MKMKTWRTCFFSILFLLSFSVYASAETPGYPANESKVDWQTSHEQTQQAESSTSDQIRVQIDNLLTIVSDGEYDEAEAEKMIQRIHSIHDSLLEGLIAEDVSMFLVNFPITDLDEFSHLKDIVPRGWEDTGAKWNDVPGAGGKPSIARIGYSESGMDHGSLNLELHEIAHPIDTFVLNDISSSSAFQTIQKQEQPLFLPDIYFEYPNEYFAEAFAYYFLNEGTRSLLKKHAPKTYGFFEMLGETVTEDTLNKAIENIHLIDEDNITAELEETLEAAIAVRNNTEASQSELRKAEFTLRQAEINATEQVHERVNQLTTIVTKGKYNREEAEQMIERIYRIHGSLLQSLADHDISVKLVNFPITELAELNHLEGEYHPDFENMNITWEEVAGIGEETVAVRIGYEDLGLARNTINVELSEIARAIDRFTLSQNSHSAEFSSIHATEQVAFLPDSYFENPENYFAEAFAYYFLNEESRNQLFEHAPETYTFISNLEISSDKDYLHEVINQALLVDEAYHTEGFIRNLSHAMDISNHPYASQFAVDEAATLLQAALIEIEPDAKGEDESEELAGSGNTSNTSLSIASNNAISYLFISLMTALFGSFLLIQRFSPLGQEELSKIKIPFQK